MMRIIRDIDEMNETARGWLAGGTVGFIPTMGYLHYGHLPLIRAAHEECEICVVSIFVNPLQFSSDAAFRQYPRNLVRDIRLLRQANVDVVFVPSAEVIFPPGYSTYVTVTGSLATRLEGEHNPLHIRGFATLMAKLLHIIRPDIAYFGQKNAQQVAIIRRLVRDFNIDINLRILPSIRDNDGLTMSSCNHLLSPSERKAAAELYRALLHGKALIEKGERNPSSIEWAISQPLQSNPLIKLEYATICHPDTFEPLPQIVPGTLLCVAAQVGEQRLLDNILWTSDGTWHI